MLKYALGIDVSKNDIHVCLSVIDVKQQVKVKASSKFANREQGFKDLLVWVNRHKKEAGIPSVTVIEATGVYYRLWV
jgi:transposase